MQFFQARVFPVFDFMKTFYFLFFDFLFFHIHKNQGLPYQYKKFHFFFICDLSPWQLFYNDNSYLFEVMFHAVQQWTIAWVIESLPFLVPYNSHSLSLLIPRFLSYYCFLLGSCLFCSQLSSASLLLLPVSFLTAFLSIEQSTRFRCLFVLNLQIRIWLIFFCCIWSLTTE